MSYTIALDLGGTLIKLAIVGNGKIIEAEEIPVADNTSLRPYLPIIEEKVTSLCSTAGIDQKQLNGIGMAFPSIVDNTSGKVLSEYVKYADVNDLQLQNWAKDKWDIPLLLENDARAALVGEWQFGAGVENPNIVLITIGTGLGSAVLIEGKVLRGRHHLAGNLGGHVTVKYDGEKCNCGNIGCLESVASTWVLPKKVRNYPGIESSKLHHEENIDFELIFRLASEGDKIATAIRNECVDAWSFGIINLVHSFDPEIVIVGGGIMKSKEYLLPHFQKMVDTHTWLPAGTVEIKAAAREQHAALLGMDYLISNKNA